MRIFSHFALICALAGCPPTDSDVTDSTDSTDSTDVPPTDPVTLFEARHGVAPPMSTDLTQNAEADFETAFTALCSDGTDDYDAETGLCTSTSKPVVVCGDGTRPTYFWDAGAPGNDNWMIFVGGGGVACTVTSEYGCWGAYFSKYGALNNGTNYTKTDGMRYPNRYSKHDGLFTPAHLVPTNHTNHFADWNRVVNDKCTADLWLGRGASAPHPQIAGLSVCSAQDGAREGVGGPDSCSDTIDNPDENGNIDGIIDCHGDAQTMSCDGAPECNCAIRETQSLDEGEAVVHHTGNLIADQVFRALASDSLRPDELPSLQSADRVVFTAHSNGSNGLFMNLDEFADRVRQHAPSARPFGLFSSYFAPSPESEGHMANDFGDPTASTVYSTPPPAPPATAEAHIWFDANGDGKPDGESADRYNDYTYRSPQGAESVKLSEYGHSPDGYDASCVVSHGGDPDDWDAMTPCRDSLHVVLNHLQTPFFVNQAQRDGSQGLKQRPYCETGPDDDTPTCNYNLRPTHYQALVRKQAADLFHAGATQRCESSTAFPYNAVGIFSQDQTNDHGSAKENTTTYAITLRLGGDGSPEYNLHDVFSAWLSTFDDTPKKVIFLQDARPDPSAKIYSNDQLGVPSARP